MILIKNITIIPMTSEMAFRGAVVVDGTKIAMVTRDEREAANFASKGATVIDGRGGVLMPGLINLHNHVSMSLLRSYADDIPLIPWLTDHIWPIEDKMTAEHVYVGAKLGIAEMLLGGTTAFCDMYVFEGDVARAAEELGMRVSLGMPFLDASYANFEPYAEKLIEKYGEEEGLVSLSLSPHAPYTVSPETLQKSIVFARKHSLPVHTHLSETKDEVAQIAERYGKTPVEYFRDLGLFDLPTLAAHCVWLSEADIKIMAEYGVSVSHNPQSNMKLGSGFAPVLEMVEAGVNVGLGTDGPSSNNDLDMFEEMRAASFMHKATSLDATVLPAYKILEMATVNGAKALGRTDLGKIEAGMTADMILIDTSRPHFHPRNDIIANVVYCGKAADVDTVIVNGEVVVSGKELVKGSLAAIYDEVAQVTEELGIECE